MGDVVGGGFLGDSISKLADAVGAIDGGGDTKAPRRNRPTPNPRGNAPFSGESAVFAHPEPHMGTRRGAMRTPGSRSAPRSRPANIRGADAANMVPWDESSYHRPGLPGHSWRPGRVTIGGYGLTEAEKEFRAPRQAFERVERMRQRFFDLYMLSESAQNILDGGNDWESLRAKSRAGGLAAYAIFASNQGIGKGALATMAGRFADAVIPRANRGVQAAYDQAMVGKRISQAKSVMTAVGSSVFTAVAVLDAVFAAMQARDEAKTYYERGNRTATRLMRGLTAGEREKLRDGYLSTRDSRDAAISGSAGDVAWWHLQSGEFWNAEALEALKTKMVKTSMLYGANPALVAALTGQSADFITRSATAGADTGVGSDLADEMAVGYLRGTLSPAGAKDPSVLEGRIQDWAKYREKAMRTFSERRQAADAPSITRSMFH